MSRGPLGCPQEYRAVFHWRGGAQVYGPPMVAALTSVDWGRTVDDVSEAKISIDRQSLTGDCCQTLGGRIGADGTVQGGLEPWIHELTLFRDTDLVWQGPVTRTVESRAGFTVEAMDVAAWLDHVVNTWRMTFKDKPNPDKYRVKGPVTKIAETILYLNLVRSSLSPKMGESKKSFLARLFGRFLRHATEAETAALRESGDWAGIMDYLVRMDTDEVIRFEKDGSDNKAIWAEYVGNILRELTKRGLLFTTVGRSLVLRGKPSSKTRAVARLSLDDFLGDVEVIRDGASAATASWATSQDQQNPTRGRTEIVGEWGTEYGRLDVLTKVSDANAEELRHAAKNNLEGRYPAPVTINVPSGAQLSPRAPVSMEDLVGGERLDVVSTGWCTQIGQGFMLSDLSVSWTKGSGEKVGISLVPLSDPYGDPVHTPDDPPGALLPSGGGAR